MEQEVKLYQIILILYSIFTYIVDFVLDIILAKSHFTDGHILCFWMTLITVFIPALILTGFNIWWYKEDAKINSYKEPSELMMIRKLLIIFLMAPLLRNCEALYYAIKSIKSKNRQEKERYYSRMLFFISDAAILNVLEAFMECGPQVVLQTCIFANLQASNPNTMTVTEIWQVAKIFFGVISMSIANGTFQRSLRITLNDRGKLNIPTLIYLIIWRFFEIISRVMALGFFASVFPYHLAVICNIHFFAMFIWIRSMETDFFENKLKESLYNLVLAEVLVFIYFNPKNEPTRKRYITYYTLIFLENTTLICIWYYYYSPDVHFKFPAFIIQFLSFIIALVLMVIYYYYLHPTIGIIRKKSEEEKPPAKLKESLKKMSNGSEAESDNSESADANRNENLELHINEKPSKTESRNCETSNTNESRILELDTNGKLSEIENKNFEASSADECEILELNSNKKQSKHGSESFKEK